MRHTLSWSVAMLTTASAMLTNAAHAFDPNAGAEPERTAPARYTPYTTTVLPRITSSNPTVAVTPTPAVTYAPPPVIVATPVAIAPQPVAASTPSLAPLPSTPAPTDAPAPVYNAAPAYVPPAPTAPQPVAGYVQPAPQQHSNAYYGIKDTSYDANRFAVGIEGYYDIYKEESVDLTDQGFFGSVTGSYTHYFDQQWYAGVDLRGSIGSVDYESISGTIDDITQWEVETRFLGGHDADLGNGSRMKFYSGLGARYFSDELKGKVASLGGAGYDRRITQIYLPIGATFMFDAYGLQFAPNLEYDHLLFGYVNSRLQSIPGFESLHNHQTDGYGIRGELMMGQVDKNGTGWQFGPFFRYWNMADSDIDTAGAFVGLEPENTRLQAGATAKLLF